ncbi:hypothetical protein GBF38_018450 [Nibea albiflora]|uniref:Uncharacterized protein n=1 Tax=Nibea albiflora TaxID=240163 RepID=A0ACB7ENY5_NIBAL|nr:hypothetical protein GBF38_018450 [Nibea albiflora]
MSVYLLVLCLVLLQQEGRAGPDPPGCDSPDVVKVAEEALGQINQDKWIHPESQQSVYGECKVSVNADPEPKLQNYSCTIREGRSII